MSADVGKYHLIKVADEQNSYRPKDEVDFVRNSNNSSQTGHVIIEQQKIVKDANHNDRPPTCNLLAKKLIPGTLYGDCEVKTSIKSSLSTLEKLAIFNLHRKRMESTIPPPTTASGTAPTIKQTTTSTAGTNQTQNVVSQPNVKERHKFVKSASIARLLGNTYNTKKFENDMKNCNAYRGVGVGSVGGSANGSNSAGGGVGGRYGGNSPVNTKRRFGSAERFQKCSNMEDSISETCLQDFRDDDKDFSAKAFRTISRSLGKLWWKRTHSVEISTPDPEHKVSYLGNVLTGWAKGEGCVEKPLNTLWRNYTQNHKPDVIMRIRVCASGLKATTRQHGLTEYWAHRITYCCAPKNYPRVFCWIYRHEGRKLKHELRCHAVLCSKESIAQDICNTLRENLDRALRDFKREKISRQNARLSLANAVYENPSLPRRKILLSVGGNNYRPPLERSKSAPKLMAIEEAIGEEDGEVEQTNEPEMPSCCVKDSMYPAMTLGRRRCRKGHSIRRTGKGFSTSRSVNLITNTHQSVSNDARNQETKEFPVMNKETCEEVREGGEGLATCTKTKSISSLGSDEDDLDKLLSYHNYDINSPLAGELLSYFDMKMKPKTSSLTNLNDAENFEFEKTLTSDPKPRPALSLDNLDSLSGEETADEDEDDESDDVYYHQAALLELIHNSSSRQIADEMNENELSKSFEGGRQNTSSIVSSLTPQQHHLDSDEGSISSGCETASTVTANMDDSSLKYNNCSNNNNTDIRNDGCSQQGQQNNSSDPCNDDGRESKNDNKHQRQEITENMEDFSGKRCNRTINFMLPQTRKFVNSDSNRHSNKSQRMVKVNNDGGDVSDSEFSDESGYVEFQEQNVLQNRRNRVSV